MMKILGLVVRGVASGLVLSGLAVIAWTQQGNPRPPIFPQPPQNPASQGGADRRNTGIPINGEIDTSPMEAQQMRTRNTDRQKKLSADADRLLALAAALKQQVDTPDKNATTVDSARKAEEIEKLAKSVKDRMKG
jgi:hypothetical protein